MKKLDSEEPGHTLSAITLSIFTWTSRRIRHVLLRDMNVSLRMHWTSRRAVEYAVFAMKEPLP
jgi:hypothetical protein